MSDPTFPLNRSSFAVTWLPVADSLDHKFAMVSSRDLRRDEEDPMRLAQVFCRCFLPHCIFDSGGRRASCSIGRCTIHPFSFEGLAQADLHLTSCALVQPAQNCQEQPVDATGCWAQLYHVAPFAEQYRSDLPQKTAYARSLGHAVPAIIDCSRDIWRRIET